MKNVPKRADQQRDHAPATVAGVDARAPDLREPTARAHDAVELELRRGVEASRLARAGIAQDAIRTDDRAGRSVARDEMLAKLVEGIDVEAPPVIVASDPEGVAIDLVSQPLRLAHFAGVARDVREEPRWWDRVQRLDGVHILRVSTSLMTE